MKRSISLTVCSLLLASTFVALPAQSLTTASLSPRTRSHTVHAALKGAEAVADDESRSQMSDGGRRHAFSVMAVSSLAFFAGNTAANALDMDAFVNRELESDTKNCDPKKDPKCIPKLSKDEALCKYGQVGNARAEACKRVKEAGGKLPDPSSQGKSLGGAYAM